MDIEKSLEIFGLSTDASQQDLKQAYKDLVQIWHPDRFSHNPRIKQKAEEKLKEINVAYETVRSFLSSKQQGSQAGRAKHEQDEHARDYSHSKPYTDENEEFQEVKNCGDGTCFGFIGKDGCSNVCGLTYQEGLKKDRYEISKTSTSSNADKGVSTAFKWFLAIVGFFALVWVINIVLERNKNGVQPSNLMPLPSSEQTQSMTTVKQIEEIEEWKREQGWGSAQPE